MDRRQIGLKLTLAELGIGCIAETFDERLVIQKSIFLAQEAGVGLGYHFYWYLRGPYSRDVSADLDNLRHLNTEGWVLDPQMRQKLHKLKRWFDGIPKEGRPRWYEIIASIRFVLATKQAASVQPADLKAALDAAGKDFSTTEIQRAIALLDEQRLASS